MTLLELIAKFNGEYVEVAGSPNALNQCTDLANLYIRDVLGLPIIEWTNAKDFPAKAGNKYDYILNTPTGVPQEGDLVIWNTGIAGHIAIFIEGSAASFKSFDQNYPVGSPCHIQGHTYSGVVGWLRCKIVPEPIAQTLDIRLSILDENNIKTEGALREILGAYQELPSLRKDKINADKEIERLRHQVEQDRDDLQAESDANTALKTAYANHLQSIGTALGNGSDLPGILHSISLLASKADNADKFEKQLKVAQYANSDLRAEIQRNEDAIKSYSLKLDSQDNELAQIKEILTKWLNIPVLTSESLSEALQGLKREIERPIWGKMIEYIKRLLSKII